MNIVNFDGAEVRTMTSREIAELTGKRHADVMRDIRNMLGQLELQVDGYTQNCVDPQNGQMYPVFKLPKDLTLTLVAGYNVKLRKRIIDRWQELESKQWPQIPQTYAAALLEAGRLALEVEQKNQELAAAQQTIAANAHKSEFFDNYAYCGGSLGFREVAKLLKAKEHEFRAFLCAKRYMYQLSGQWMAYAQHLDAGRFEVKTGTAERNNHAFAKTVFTPKGVQWIAGEWGKHQAEKELNCQETGSQCCA